MIRHRFATALVVLSTLALAGGGLARADDLRYAIHPSTGVIFEGRFRGGQLASERPVGQARMVQLQDGNYYWLGPPQLGLRPEPVRNNVSQPGPRGPAPGAVQHNPGISPASAALSEQYAQEADQRADKYERMADEADSRANSMDSVVSRHGMQSSAERYRRMAESQRARANDLRMKASGVRSR